MRRISRKLSPSLIVFLLVTFLNTSVIFYRSWLFILCLLEFRLLLSYMMSTCAEPIYTSPKGIQFSLYCDSDRTSAGDIDNAGADNVEDCMNQCSMHPGKACGAAAFDSGARKCFFKNITITEVGAVAREGWILGIANRTQYENLPTECSNNGGKQTTKNGLDFTVYCDQIVNGFDTCPDDSPDCRAHAESLDECVEVCSTLHPLCTGVAWDPTLQFGYLNCYPKNVTARVFDKSRTSAGDGLRVVKALFEIPADDCPAAVNGTLVASEQQRLLQTFLR